MRILHIVTDIRLANGIMSVVLNYAKAMPEDIKFDVMYFKEFPENRKDDIENLGGKVIKIAQPSIKSFFKCDIDEFLKEHKGEYAAAHIHAPHLAVMLVPKLRRYGIKNIAVHCHLTNYSLNPKNVLRNKLLSSPVKHMNVERIGCGREAGEIWYGKDNFYLLPNAIMCKKFRYNSELRDQKRKEFGIENNIVIGHIGRVSPPQKNHEFLFKIFAKIVDKYAGNARLMLVGAVEDERLRCLAEELGIRDKIMYMGQVKDVSSLLHTMDVFVFPSLLEGLPVSVIEAQAAGLPVVMSNAVTPDVLCTKKSTIVSLDCPDYEWADIVIEHIKMGVGDTYSEMKKAGWDIEDTSKNLVDFYRTGVKLNDSANKSVVGFWKTK